MKKSLIELHIAILLAACSGIFGNLIALNAVLITGYRMAISAVILCLLCVILKQGVRLFTPKSVKTMVSGALLAVHWIFFYASIKYSNVSVGVVCFTLSGFFTALLAPIINRRKFQFAEIALSSLTLVGIYMIFSFDDAFKLGIMLGAVSSLLFALYACLNERINMSGEVVPTTFKQMLGGTVAVMLILPLISPVIGIKVFLPTLTDATYLLMLAAGSTVAMCILLNEAQKKVNAFTVSLSFNFEPIYSIFLAVLLFHEDKTFTRSFYIGISFIVLSLALQMLRMKNRHC
ncbi:MAG: DMT family transporter [Muribaculaceae bacterium]|nr:DMT family transporter [Muribaculaceae bacterium]